jgi:2-polyprenyl-3-methyl-5-hydroxy-6-metoxy-1,4-benzoquinol methylase
MREQTIALAGEMGLADQYVFFGDWVPYEDWPAVLLEADVGLSLHPDTVEARLAYRSRVLDYIWAGLPMVLTRGDAMSAVAEQYGLGVIVDFKDDSAVADAILTVLERPRSAWQEGFSQVQAEMTWERAAEPLIDFCLQPTPAADRIAKIRHAKHDAAKGSDEVILDLDVLRDRVRALDWYHTIDLGHGIVTPGIFDHRPYLPLYGIPEDLTGKTALDVGAASGFFSFEMERRGAAVTAIDLPAWEDHDFGPNYEPDMTRDQATRYLREPILLAREALGSQIEKLEMSVHDLSPETVGTHDLVFCGSMLLHLTDPIQALWRLKSVTRDMAIIATVIHPTSSGEPLALFVGHERGDGWWFPNSACFEAWLQSAGFAGWEWFSEFRLDYRDGQEGPYHGVVRAWTSLAGRRILQAEPSSRIAAGTGRPAASLQQRPSELDEEIARLRALVDAYERGRFMQWMRRIHGWRKKVGL